MTARPLKTVLLPVTLVVLLVPAVAVPLNARAQGGLDKSLFISVLDEAGKPVKDIVADDILIREDGVDRQVVAVKPASQPISVAVLVDTAQGSRVTDAYGTPEEYVQDIRKAVGTFGKTLLGQSPNAVISLTEFGQAAVTMVPFTSKPDDFMKGVNRLVARPGVGSVLLEALFQANNDLIKQLSTRRAIVSLNLEPADEQSREDLANKIKDAFRKSGAQLWALSVQRGKLETSKRDLVLNDSAKLTGGQRDHIVGISAAEGILKGYADALTYQYEVVYKRPESSKPKAIQLGTARQGVKLHASGFAPQ